MRLGAPLAVSHLLHQLLGRFEFLLQLPALRFAGSLEDILCIQEERVVGNDNTVRYKNRVLQIPADRHRHHYVKARVRVHEYPDHSLAVFHGPRRLARYSAKGELIDEADHKAA